MSFTLEPLPYAYDALQPFLSRNPLNIIMINITRPM